VQTQGYADDNEKNSDEYEPRLEKALGEVAHMDESYSISFKIIDALGSYAIRWDEKAGLRTGCGVRSQVIGTLEAQEIKETGNEKG
jgi:hypothetical protein